jgi:hypothetical protein
VQRHPDSWRGAAFDRSLLSGGHKHAGNGYAFGISGLDEYRKVKAMPGQG